MVWTAEDGVLDAIDAAQNTICRSQMFGGSRLPRRSSSSG